MFNDFYFVVAIFLQYEPSLLPEPQHVMLNHMYALSIKDGVMALSATHRYKKKFVTTLLYKPIWNRWFKHSVSSAQTWRKFNDFLRGLKAGAK